MVLELRHVLWLTLALMWMLMVLEPRHRMWLVLALAWPLALAWQRTRADAYSLMVLEPRVMMRCRC
jgi:hypothetical protein